MVPTEYGILWVFPKSLEGGEFAPIMGNVFQARSARHLIKVCLGLRVAISHSDCDCLGLWDGKEFPTVFAVRGVFPSVERLILEASIGMQDTFPQPYG